MGFKLKKKNTGESTGRKGGNAFFTKIQSQIDQLSRVFGDSEKSKPLIYGAAGCLLAALITLLDLLRKYCFT
ncbi:hypothetical protein CU320_10875 [Acinetobacter pseudolwoffii]|uniref:Uncharacterized protein n=1 Tax=Acinetobacter pseudolwoffii TaxID=2053287 RepID=A0A2H9UK95_9GAMM|nr:hypothetical protein [Acinetobacter pseudolwoffii]PJI32093.1 hypothetical protein CU320_10875 [Acinetobacter pseudolwoffii]